MKFYIHIISPYDMNGLCTEEDTSKLDAAYCEECTGTSFYVTAVWHTKRRETPGVYEEDSRGNLHYLGCHSPIPEELEAVMNKAFESFSH